MASFKIVFWLNFVAILIELYKNKSWDKINNKNE